MKEKEAVISQEDMDNETDVEQKGPEGVGFFPNAFGNKATLATRGVGGLSAELGNRALLSMQGGKANNRDDAWEKTTKTKNAVLMGLGEVTVGLLTVGIWPLIRCIFNHIVANKKKAKKAEEAQQEQLALQPVLQQALLQAEQPDPEKVNQLVDKVKSVGIGDEEIKGNEQPGNESKNDVESELEDVEQQVERGEAPIVGDRSKGPLLYEKPGGESKDAPPAIEVHVMQSKKGEKTAQKHITDDCGHTFLTLRYSRFSTALGRKQRYMTTFGFWPKGTFMPFDSLGAHATIPGMIKDDDGHDSDIGKRFPATNEQINKIIQATPRYPESGYSLISRNCTTFAADMTGTEAGLDTGGIFRNEEWDIGGMSFMLPAAQLVAAMGKKKLRERITDEMGKKDLSFEAEGKNYYTAQDVKNYDESLDYGKINLKGYSPSAVGERIRNSDSGNFVSRHRGGKTEDLLIELQTGNFSKAVGVYLEREQKLHDGKNVPDIDPVFLDEAMQQINAIAPMLGGMLHSYELFKGMGTDVDRFQVQDALNQVGGNAIENIAGVTRAASTWMSKYSAVFPYIAMPVLDLIGNCTRLSEKISDKIYDAQSLDVSTEYGALLGNLVGKTVGQYSPLESLALDRAFGGRKESNEAIARLIKLQQQEKLTKDEQSERRKLEIKYSNIQKIMVTEMARFDKTALDQNDMDYAFGVLPTLKGDKANKNTAQRISYGKKDLLALAEDDYAARYQMLALNQIFGGLGTINDKYTQRKEAGQIGTSVKDHGLVGSNLVAAHAMESFNANTDGMNMVIKALANAYSRPEVPDTATSEEIVGIALNRILQLYYPKCASSFGFTGPDADNLDARLESFINFPSAVQPDMFAPELSDLIPETAGNVERLRAALMPLAEAAIASLRRPASV